MSLETLSKLRFLVPAVIFFIHWGILGKLTGDWKLETALSPEEILETSTVFLIGLLYYILPLRKWSNRRNYDKVNSNITREMNRIGNANTSSENLNWQKIRPFFYKLVNADASLTFQSKRAMFNGLLWTSTADVRAISIIFALFSIAYHFVLNSQGALVGTVIFAVIAVTSLLISHKLTEMHIKIGNTQIEIIESLHSSEVKDFFKK